MSDRLNFGDEGWRPTSVHPLADTFPAISDEDLQGLADDIKENGQINPIVVDSSGNLLDGRMRLSACDIAGVEPWFEQLEDGKDVEAFIWSANRRRDLTKGQRAMVAAKVLSDGNKLASSGQFNASSSQNRIAKLSGTVRATLQKAILVHEYRPDLTDEVKAGIRTLEDAYRQAESTKRSRETEEQKIIRIQKIDEELARQVKDREKTVDEAIAELDQRDKAEAAARDAVFLNLVHVTRYAGAFAETDALSKIPDWLATAEGRRVQDRYFEQGAAEIMQKLATARAGIDAVEALYSRIVEKENGNGEAPASASEVAEGAQGAVRKKRGKGRDVARRVAGEADGRLAV